jgi:hypothetical protein
MLAPNLMVRGLFVVLAGMTCEGAAQTPPSPALEQALAETRRALKKCQAMPQENERVRGCVTVCKTSLDGLPTTKPGFFPTLVDSCTKYLASAERALQNIEDQKQQQAKAQKETAARYAAMDAEFAKQSGAPANTAPASAAQASPAPGKKIALSLDGAIDWGEYENDLTFHRVFIGDFDSYRKGSLAVRALMTYYLEGFQAYCGEFLPPDAVTVVRKTFLVSQNAAGFEQHSLIGTTEIRMAPRFVDGYENFSAGAGMAAFVDVRRPDRMMKDAVDFLKTWQKDGRLFFSVEACQGAAMLQMGENIARVTSGRRPVQSEPNAAQLLANLRVRVPQNVEEADVRAKRAKADAWWSVQRASWSKPPVTQAYEDQNGRVYKIQVKYEAIAPDFAIPLPNPRPDQLVEIDVAKSYTRRIRSIRFGFETLSPYDVSRFKPEQAEIYEKDVHAAYTEGARILKCTYDAGGTLNIIEYWFRKNPQSIDLESSRATWDKHPLLKVRSARSDCPVMMP